MESTILARIVADKKKEVAAAKAALPLGALEKIIYDRHPELVEGRALVSRSDAETQRNATEVSRKGATDATAQREDVIRGANQDALLGDRHPKLVEGHTTVSRSDAETQRNTVDGSQTEVADASSYQETIKSPSRARHLPRAGGGREGGLLKQTLLARTTTGIIAEFKRRSPSKGWLNEFADPLAVGRGYAAQGAAAMSVLTDSPFFGGSPADLQALAGLSIPLLRKDFMVDEYQFYQAKAWGASVVLLIAACLEPAQTQAFTQLAHELGMEVLLEVHDAEELQAHYHEGVDLVGVNCRNLKTFELNLNLFEELLPQMPEGVAWVAESGIHSAGQLLSLSRLGYHGFLMGEQFMKQPDPAIAFGQFVQELNELS